MWRMEQEFYLNERNIKFEAIANRVNEIFQPTDITLDSTGNYVIHKSLNHVLFENDKDDVTIVTHCTAEHLVYLPDLALAWDGPISITLFLNSREGIETIVKSFALCNVGILSKVLFHVVYPIHSPIDKDKFIFDKNSDGKPLNPDLYCSDFRTCLRRYQALKNNYQSPVDYPGNLLRNIAMQECRTNFVLPIDIDCVPSKNLRSLFNAFQSKCHLKDHLNISYVVPAYEIRKSYFKRNTASFPVDKRELLQLLDAGIVRPFYVEICEHCQGRTKHAEWEKIQPSTSLQPAYDVSWGHSYEPFYIALRSSTPKYDERFSQYGYNRVSQICEMHVAGHNFAVLNEGFVLHVGFKSKDDFHSTKDSEHASNWYTYEGFMSRLSRKYPDSNRTCLDEGYS